jgi:hypothetical protein
MPFLTVFRNTFAGSLLSNIAPNLDKYRRNDKWVLEMGSQSARDLATRIELRSPLILDEPDDNNLKDLENAIRVHKALNQLTPLQARDPRLWARLTHVDCWQYMRKRWPLERFGADAEKGARFITTRYFISQTDSRALMRNGIARLWWTASMSYDAQRKNPYELTSVLLYTLDITQQIMERNMGRSPVIGDQGRDRVRRLAKFLNLYGGVCLLDCLTQTDIIKLLGGELERILANEGKRKKAVKTKT